MSNDFIQKFEIIGLFGYKDISITFKNSTLIVIGENGFGKTSILNALNFLITHSYKRLLEIKFKTIGIKIADKFFSFERILIEQYSSYLERQESHDRSIIDFVRRNIDNKIFNTVIDLLNEGKKRISLIL